MQEASGLHHEGRALDVGLLARGDAAVPDDGLTLLLGLARDVGFDYAVTLDDGRTVHMSATDDSCRRAIDLAFLVDASGSISQGDYERALGGCAAEEPCRFRQRGALGYVMACLPFYHHHRPHLCPPPFPLHSLVLHKDFVADVAEQFELGSKDATRVGMSIFSGYTSHQSTIAGVPDCPVGTLFEANGLVGA